MDKSIATTNPTSETAVTKPGKTVGDRLATGKVDKTPAAKRDRKTAPATKEVPVTVKDTEIVAQEPTVTQEVPVTVKDAEPIGVVPTVTEEVPAAATDAQPTAQGPSAPDSTPDATAPTVTEPKKPTKADLAKAIYDEMVTQPNPDRKDIIARFKAEANLTTTGAQSYYYKFQKESGRVVEKGPTKMDKAREVFDALTKDGKARKEIIAALIKDVGLTKGGASTYYQTLKKTVAKPTE